MAEAPEDVVVMLAAEPQGRQGFGNVLDGLPTPQGDDGLDLMLAVD